MCPFGIRGVPLWGTGFCFLRIGEQFAVPSLKVARRCNVGPLAVERRAFGKPPMRGDAITVDAEVGARCLDDETVVLKFAEPALNRSHGFGAEIGGGIAVGSKNLSIVEAVYPQIASQNHVQRSRAERQLLPRRRCQGRADQRHERRQVALLSLLLAHEASTNVRGRKRPISIGTPPVLIARFQARLNTSTARTSAGAKMQRFCPLQRIGFVVFFWGVRRT